MQGTHDLLMLRYRFQSWTHAAVPLAREDSRLIQSFHDSVNRFWGDTGAAQLTHTHTEPQRYIYQYREKKLW
jgi:hypothetical protein